MTPSVHVAGQPLLNVREGVSYSARITVSPGDSELNDQLTAAMFAVEIEPSYAEPLEMIGVGLASDGTPTLELRPRCSVSSTHDEAAFVPVRVRTEPASLAAPADLSIQIENNEGDDCAPRARVWLGDCAQVPDETSALLTLPVSDAPPGLCMSAAVQDPDSERLWLRTSTTAPDTLLAPARLPAADDVTEIAAAIPVGDTRSIRGEFALSYQVYRSEPGPGVQPDASGNVVLVVGAPGDVAIEQPSPSPEADEFDAVSIPLRLWRYPEPGDNRLLCAVARRTTDIETLVERTKPFLRVYGDNDVSAEGEPSCGSASVTLRVSPPIDAAELEVVTVDALACTDAACADGEARATLDVSIAVSSRADQLSCTTFDGSERPKVACANLFGDDTPEVFMITGVGSTCAFYGDEFRYPGVVEWEAYESVPGKMSLPLAVEQIPVPRYVAAFAWDAGDDTSEDVILGEFTASPYLRTLAIQIDEDSSLLSAYWKPAERLGISDAEVVPLAFARAIGPSVTKGSTHLVFPRMDPATGAWTLEFRCITDPAADASCAGEITNPIVPAGRTIVGIGLADVDADGDADVALYTFDAPGPGGTLRAEVFEMLWDPDPKLGTSVAFPPLVVEGDGVMATTVPNSDVQNVYFAVESDDPESRLYRLRGAADFFTRGAHSWGPENQIPTPGPVLGVVGSGDGVIVGVPLGVWKLVDGIDGAPTTWSLVDPVLAEAAGVGEVTAPPPAYGAALSPCLSGPDAVVFTSSDLSARYTWLGITPVDP
jgi:hypothetical protein